jgi:hypothetical protein
VISLVVEPHKTDFVNIGLVWTNDQFHLSLHLLKVIVEPIDVLINLCYFLNLLLSGSAVIIRGLITFSIWPWYLRYWDCLFRLSFHNLCDNTVNNVDKFLADDKILHNIEQEAETLI